MRISRPLLGHLLLVLVACAPALPGKTSTAQAQTGEASLAPRLKEPRYVALMNELHSKYGFDQHELEQLFSQTKFQPEIPKKFEQPAELLPYNQYRSIFITPEVISQGKSYLQNHRELLQAVEQRYGVDASVLVAILGVETRFGKRPDGGFLVFDALNTVFSAVPQREAFARKELIEFLLLCREEKLDPLSVKGSYAGAMGAPQFMPSSYRHYSVDYDQDGKRDLWQTDQDILASIANYLKLNGWQRGAPIRLQVTADAGQPTVQALLNQGLKGKSTVSALLATGVAWAGPTVPPPVPVDGGQEVSLLSYPTADGEQTAMLFPNFRAILTYNRAVNYALVVSELADLLNAS
jgi:membrane-bound lytic murein transglycosylase B